MISLLSNVKQIFHILQPSNFLNLLLFFCPSNFLEDFNPKGFQKPRYNMQVTSSSECHIKNVLPRSLPWKELPPNTTTTFRSSSLELLVLGFFQCHELQVCVCHFFTCHFWQGYSRIQTFGCSHRRNKDKVLVGIKGTGSSLAANRVIHVKVRRVFLPHTEGFHDTATLGVVYVQQSPRIVFNSPVCAKMQWDNRNLSVLSSWNRCIELPNLGVHAFL